MDPAEARFFLSFRARSLAMFLNAHSRGIRSLGSGGPEERVIVGRHWDKETHDTKKEGGFSYGASPRLMTE